MRADRQAGTAAAWQSVVNLKLAIDLRNRIIHGYDSVDDEIVYLTVTDDLGALKTDLSRLFATRGWAI